MNYTVEMVASTAIKNEIDEKWWRDEVQKTLDEIDKDQSKFAEAGGLYRRSVTWKSIFEGGDKEIEIVVRRVAVESLLVVVGFTDEIEALEGKLEGVVDGRVPVEVACTEKVTQLFTDEEIGQIVDATLTRIANGAEPLDGVNNIAAVHSYDHAKGRVDTFSVYMRTSAVSPINVHVGMPD